MKAVTLILMLGTISVHAATLALKDGSSFSGEITGVEWDFYSVQQATKSGDVMRIVPRSDVVKIDAPTERESKVLATPEPDFESSEEQNSNELPQERTLSVAALQTWYGGAIDFHGDAELAVSVQRAEALIIGYLRVLDAAKRKAWLAELEALNLDPRTVRTVLQSGPYALGNDLKTGRFRARANVNGIAGGIVNFTGYVPENYTSKKKWPLIVLLHGTMGNGDNYMNFWTHNDIAPGYILIAPWANHAHGFGPSTLGRGQVFAAIDWAEAHYRVDTDRIFITGASMGGAGTKRLAMLQPDRFAAGCADSGAPLEASLESLYKNLRSVPLFSWSGEKDKLVPNAVVRHEKDVVEALKLPFTYVIDPNGDHCSNPNMAADTVKYFEDKKRTRYPERLTFASLEDEIGLRHYWIEITRTDDAANQLYSFNVLNILKVVDFSNGDIERGRDMKGVVEKGGDILVDSRRMWRKPRELDVHLDRAKNSVMIEGRALVRAFRIYLDDEMLDLDQEIKVSYMTQVVAAQKVTRSIAFLLDEARKRGRRDVSYWGVIEVKFAP